MALHASNPSYPPGSELYDPEELYCTEDETLCTPDQLCLCCLADTELDKTVGQGI